MAAGLSLGALDKCLGLVFQYEETTILFAFAGTIFFFFVMKNISKLPILFLPVCFENSV